MFLIKNLEFHVLQGTTGSGKTMVYFEALKEIINKGFQGINSITRNWINWTVSK